MQRATALTAFIRHSGGQVNRSTKALCNKYNIVGVSGSSNFLSKSASESWNRDFSERRDFTSKLETKGNYSI